MKADKTSLRVLYQRVSEPTTCLYRAYVEKLLEPAPVKSRQRFLEHMKTYAKGIGYAQNAADTIASQRFGL